MNTTKLNTGLSPDEVLESRKQHGINVLTPPKKEPVWRLFLKKFDDPIIKILLIAALLSLGIGFVNNEFTETIGIFAAVFLATTVAFVFEYDANKKFDLLNQVNDDTPVQVKRGGRIAVVPKKDIVVGDVVLVNTGDEIPADGDLAEAVSLQIDESCLTGEPIINKTTDPAFFEPDATYRSNRLMRGTKVMDGNGIMIVTEVGDNTEYGKVARTSTEDSGEDTPLNKQLTGLAKLISVIGFSVSIVTFFALFIKDVVSGSLNISLPQWYLLGGAAIAFIIMSVKIWMPILYDAISLAAKKEKTMPPLVERRSWWQLLLIGCAFFAIIVGIGFIIGINPADKSVWLDINTINKILGYFMVAVTLIVVTVPEGLPMSVTLSLALSMKRMLRSNNLVRKMHATETMGATTVICTDKTGTLTQNRMHVNQTMFFDLADQRLADDQLSTLIAEGIAVNSTAHIDYSNADRPSAIGNPTEAALLLWLDSQHVTYGPIREQSQIISQLSFSTERKYMATVVFSPQLQKRVLYVKGAPEIVLTLSQRVRHGDASADVDTVKSLVDDTLQHYQSRAMRTLGFAYEIIDDDKPRIVDGRLANATLTYLGVVGISDPIRDDVPPAVNECIKAGIRVIIVTGDTPGTAMEIGRQIGIITGQDDKVLTGPEFAAMSEDDILKLLPSLKILCRARPNDKQLLVRLLQKNGEVVAVTGDGTNDAPALNFAHVGLSMGSGTSVAKEASDITILDDSFKSIGSAVMWGRSLYQNIQRFIVFQLTINITAMMIVLIGSIVGHDIPLTVTQMLWVNLIMDTFAAGALASLPPNKNVMKHKPRNNSDFIISRKMKNNILAVAAIFTTLLLSFLYMFQNSDGSIDIKDLTIFFTAFVMLQFWNLFNVKAFDSGRSVLFRMSKSIGFIIVAITILIGQICIVQFGGNVFRTVPLSLPEWLFIIGVTSLIFVVEEIARWLIRRKKN